MPCPLTTQDHAHHANLEAHWRSDGRDAPTNCAALDNAALTCDIPSLRALESSLSASELAHVDAGGRTAMHRPAGSLYFLKAGELSSLVPWPNASRTIYKSSIKHTVLRALGPIVRTMLERSPSLASAADERGVTVLHLAARKGELACRCAASLAPGQRETRTRTSACSVQRQWPRS